MFGRQGSYIHRSHAARTDTIRRPENNGGGNYENLGYYDTPPGSPSGSYQMDVQEMTSPVANGPQREQTVHHGQPPSYEEGESCS